MTRLLIGISALAVAVLSGLISETRANELNDCAIGRCDALLRQRVYVLRPVSLCKRPGEIQTCTTVSSGSWIVRNIIGFDHFRKALQVIVKSNEVAYIDTANLHQLTLVDPGPAKKAEAERVARRQKADAEAAERRAVALKNYYDCVKTKVVTYAKTTEPANVVVNAALGACPQQQDILSAVTGLNGGALQNMINYSIGNELAAFVIEERLRHKQ